MAGLAFSRLRRKLRNSSPDKAATHTVPTTATTPSTAKVPAQGGKSAPQRSRTHEAPHDVTASTAQPTGPAKALERSMRKLSLGGRGNPCVSDMACETPPQSHTAPESLEVREVATAGTTASGSVATPAASHSFLPRSGAGSDSDGKPSRARSFMQHLRRSTERASSQANTAYAHNDTVAAALRGRSRECQSHAPAPRTPHIDIYSETPEAAAGSQTAPELLMPPKATTTQDRVASTESFTQGVRGGSVESADGLTGLPRRNSTPVPRLQLPRCAHADDADAQSRMLPVQPAAGGQWESSDDESDLDTASSAAVVFASEVSMPPEWRATPPSAAPSVPAPPPQEELALAAEEADSLRVAERMQHRLISAEPAAAAQPPDLDVGNDGSAPIAAAPVPIAAPVAAADVEAVIAREPSLLQRKLQPLLRSAQRWRSRRRLRGSAAAQALQAAYGDSNNTTRELASTAPLAPAEPVGTTPADAAHTSSTIVEELQSTEDAFDSAIDAGSAGQLPLLTSTRRQSSTAGGGSAHNTPQKRRSSSGSAAAATPKLASRVTLRNGIAGISPLKPPQRTPQRRRFVIPLPSALSRVSSAHSIDIHASLPDASRALDSVPDESGPDAAAQTGTVDSGAAGLLPTLSNATTQRLRSAAPSPGGSAQALGVQSLRVAAPAPSPEPAPAPTQPTNQHPEQVSAPPPSASLAPASMPPAAAPPLAAASARTMQPASASIAEQQARRDVPWLAGQSAAARPRTVAHIAHVRVQTAQDSAPLSSSAALQASSDNEAQHLRHEPAPATPVTYAHVTPLPRKPQPIEKEALHAARLPNAVKAPAATQQQRSEAPPAVRPRPRSAARPPRHDAAQDMRRSTLPPSFDAQRKPPRPSSVREAQLEYDAKRKRARPQSRRQHASHPVSRDATMMGGVSAEVQSHSAQLPRACTQPTAVTVARLSERRAAAAAKEGPFDLQDYLSAGVTPQARVQARVQARAQARSRPAWR